MVIRYQPGQPNPVINAFSSTIWRDSRLIVYCSGNNLIILQDPATLLQTVYVNSDIHAVAIDSDKGLIAASYANKVLVLEPAVSFDKPPKWHEFTTLEGSPDDGDINTLSWGYSCNELATGSMSLSIWNIDYDRNLDHRLIWSQRLANPVDFVEFSPDAYLLASAGVQGNDKLVKLWKRSSYDDQNVTLDFNYLPHPKPVVKLWWKRPYFKGQTIKNTMYTLALDGVLRIWCESNGSSDLGNLQLSGAIDQLSCTFMPIIYDSPLIKRTVELLVSSDSVSSELIPRLVELAKMDSDICVAFECSPTTGKNEISVYSIENASLSANDDYLLTIRPIVVHKPLDYSLVSASTGDCCSAKSPVHANSQPLMPFHPAATGSKNSSTNLSESSLRVLIHDYVSASMKCISMSLLDLLTCKDKDDLPIIQNYVFTGHYKSVQNIVRSSDGVSLFSQSRFSENILWRPRRLANGGVTLAKSCYIKTRNARVVIAVLMRYGQYVITLLETNQLILWDCKSANIATELYSLDGLPNKEPLCAFFLPESDGHGPEHRKEKHLVVVYSAKEIYAWVVDVDGDGNGNGSATIKPLNNGASSLPYPQDCTEELKLAVAVDPVGWNFTVSEQIDSFSRDVLTSLSTEGVLRNWTAGIVNGKLSWLQTSVISIDEPDAKKAQVSSTRKAAIASSDGRMLRIWDTSNGILEYQEHFDSKQAQNYVISDLDWTTAPDNQCVLGVGFNLQAVILYCQQRYDYTNDTPSWAPFRKVDISQYTSHQIGDSIWLKNGTFVVGAGNQLFIQDEKVDMNDETTKQLLGSRNTTAALENSNSIFDICSVMSGPLPLYHPQLLIQMMFAGNFVFATEVLTLLLDKIKFASVSEPSMVVEVNSLLDMTSETISFLTDVSNSAASQHSVYQHIIPETQNLAPFSQDIASDLVGWLQRYSLPYLTRHQQITLVSVIEALSQMLEDIRSLDENGMRFLLGYKLFSIHRGSQNAMTMRDFNWALHSESHSILVDLVTGVSKTGKNSMLWPAMREVGFAFWLKNEELRDQMEVLAQNAFNIDNKRDPVRCSLYYLALKKKNVLVGLWRISSGHKEQPKTLKLLSNDFTTPRWRSAALKNAYALLGKHRFEYAAAFFLLGDSLKDAVNVVIKNIQDISLAIAIARIYEGSDTGPVLQSIIKEYVLPQASLRNDKWVVSWAQWLLGNHDLSVRSLVGDLFSMGSGSGMSSRGSAHLEPHSRASPISLEDLRSPGIPSSVEPADSKTFLVDDPVLIHMYRVLRKRHLVQDTNMDGIEYRFVLKVCMIYSRMGCDLLALELLKYWSFQHDTRGPKDDTDGPSEAAAAENEHDNNSNNNNNNKPQDIPSMLDSFEKPDVPVSLSKPPPTAFQEPDMSAFSFGF